MEDIKEEAKKRSEDDDSDPGRSESIVVVRKQNGTLYQADDRRVTEPEPPEGEP
jgi:hypothetical protein